MTVAGKQTYVTLKLFDYNRTIGYGPLKVSRLLLYGHGSLALPRYVPIAQDQLSEV